MSGPHDRQAGTGMVSVVMIFLDAGAFIREAIESVLAQSYPNWELLLVDDGSSDDGPAVAERLSRLNPDRIRLLRHPGGLNRGMSASRNLGLAHARGEYIAFLDADDVYDTHRLLRHVQMLRRYPDVVMVQSLMRYWYSWEAGGDSRPDQPQEPPVPGGQRIVPPPDLLRLMLETHGATHPHVSSITIRTAAARAVEGSEDRFRGIYEDQVLIAKLYLHGPVLHLGEHLAWYRQHEGSLVHRLARTREYTLGRPHSPRAEFMAWLEAYLASRAPDERELRRIARKWLMAERYFACRLVADWRTAVPPLLRSLAEGILPAEATARLTGWWGERKLHHARRRAERIGADILLQRHKSHGGQHAGNR